MNTSCNSSTYTWHLDCSNNSSNSVVAVGSFTNSNNFTALTTFMIKRCRKCNHAHTESETMGCYDIFNNSIAFVPCQCKEYVPTDNLEYLEYLSKKKEAL